jgi:hypothetical protein
MKGKRSRQGIQGSYNEVRTAKLTNGQFERTWVKGMVQELNYNGAEMRKWRTFATRVNQ